MEEEIKVQQVEFENSGSLNYNDLVFLASNYWGLRHVSEIGNATKQFNEGLESGDAISISAPNNFIPEGTFPDSSKEMISHLQRDQQLKLVPDGRRQEVLSGFEKAVSSFIKDSVGMDINMQPSEINARELINHLTSNLSFIIAKFIGADTPYDNKNYYGLGKCGKQPVPGENMVALLNTDIGLTEIQVNSDIPEEDLDNPVNERTFSKIRDCLAKDIMSKLVTEIKARQGI